MLNNFFFSFIQSVLCFPWVLISSSARPLKKWAINVCLRLYAVYLGCFDDIGVLGVVWQLLAGFAPIEYVRDAWSYTYLSVNFTKHNHPVIQAKKAKDKRQGHNAEQGVFYQVYLVCGILSSRYWSLKLSK